MRTFSKMIRFSRKALMSSAVAAVLAAGAGLVAAQATDIQYEYDALGRLKSASYNNGEYMVVYEYDENGNRTELVISGANLPPEPTGTDFTIDSVTGAEGDTLTFTVTKTGPDAATVSYATVTDTAGASDFTSASGDLVFAANEVSKTITIVTNTDTDAESDETFFVDLSNATNGATISVARGTATLTDVPSGGPASFAIGDTEATEGNPLVYEVTRTGGVGTYTVEYTTSRPTAEPDDFAEQTGTLTFGPNEFVKTISVVTLQDEINEPRDVVRVTLSAPSGDGTLSDEFGSGTINNDDPVPNYSVSDATVNEGGDLVFTITPDRLTERGFSVTYQTADGTATAGSDYTTTSGSVPFGNREPSQTVSVPTLPDGATEGNETLNMTITVNGNGGITDGTGVGTITENAPPPPAFSIDNVSGAEGDSLVFTVTKTGDGAANVNYATATGTAGATDFTAASGSLVFGSTETTKTITIATSTDTDVESDETFFVDLSNPTNGATLTNSRGTATLTDVPAGGPASFSISDTESTEGQALVYEVIRTGGVGSYTIDFATSRPTAEPDDFVDQSGTLSFGPTEFTKTVSVVTLQDEINEPRDVVRVTLSNPSGDGTIADAFGAGTINNDDPVPVYSINDATVEEGGNLVFTITPDRLTERGFSVTYQSADGTATAGSDYTATSGTVPFSNREATQTVTVPTLTDAVTEGTETLDVSITVNGNAGIGDGTGVGSITEPVAGPEFSTSPASAVEGNAIQFVITKTGTATQSHTVNFSANAPFNPQPGEAGSSDFTATSGSVTFAPGVNSMTVSVLTTDDSIAEGDETFLFNLTSVTGNATIAPQLILGTIQDNDTVTSEFVRNPAGEIQAPFTEQITGAPPFFATYTTRDEQGNIIHQSLIDFCDSNQAPATGYQFTGNGCQLRRIN